MFHIQEFNPIKKKWVTIGRVTTLQRAEIYLQAVRETYTKFEYYKEHKTATRIYDNKNSTIILV